MQTLSWISGSKQVAQDHAVSTFTELTSSQQVKVSPQPPDPKQSAHCSGWTSLPDELVEDVELETELEETELLDEDDDVLTDEDDVLDELDEDEEEDEEDEVELKVVLEVPPPPVPLEELVVEAVEDGKLVVVLVTVVDPDVVTVVEALAEVDVVVAVVAEVAEPEEEDEEEADCELTVRSSESETRSSG
jgi:hypothetical protein